MSDSQPRAISIERAFRQTDFDAFARLSGDDNPIHVDAAFSAQTAFGRTVAHGMLLYTVLRGLVDRIAPGARQISQELMFPAPAFAGELIRFEARVTDEKAGRLAIALRATRIAGGVCVCEGACMVEGAS